MTKPETQHSAAEQFGDAFVRIADVIEDLRKRLPPARAMESMLEDAAPLGIGSDDVVVDVGAGRGRWSTRLVERYKCKCVAVDVSYAQIRDNPVGGVVADVDRLPFTAGAVDAVWCRDMLEMVDDPDETLSECFRVLRPGGGMLLYVPFMTERMEPLEKAEMLALHSGTWWGEGRDRIDAAIRSAGFEVLHFDVTSPEYSEDRLLRTDEATQQLVEHAQLRRGRGAIVDAVGEIWYERFLAWSRWQMYLILGKLENGVWLLRKP